MLVELPDVGRALPWCTDQDGPLDRRLDGDQVANGSVSGQG
jgi:hypothetical protein